MGDPVPDADRPSGDRRAEEGAPPDRTAPEGEPGRTAPNGAADTAPGGHRNHTESGDHTPPTAPPDRDVGESTFLAILVVRSGGIGGLRREWHVNPPEDHTEPWSELVERCPWEAPLPPAVGADQFVWRIAVRLRSGGSTRDLADSQLTGPWRSLVDAVREADS